MTLLLKKSDIYIAGYINALIDTQHRLYRLGEARDNEDWEVLYHLVCSPANGRNPLTDYIIDWDEEEEEEVIDKTILEFNTRVVMSRYVNAMGGMGDVDFRFYAEVQHGIDSSTLEDECAVLCKTSPKIGRTWWKQLGYCSPCSCAIKADQLRRY
tara:strand:- start:2302 stop:2766 length:465 start_codon:yes stop_codon:yes gene_type:complete